MADSGSGEKNRKAENTMAKAEETKAERAKGGSSAALSLWALLARSSFYQVLAVLLLLAAAETALFGYGLRDGWAGAFEAKIEEGRIPLLFLAALGGIFFLLVHREGVLDSAGRYTMMRLRIGRERLFVIKTAYNAFCLLVLFAAQTGLVFWLAWLYGQAPGTQGMPGGTALFLAFYRSEFLHGLFPMAETGKWLRNGLALLAFGMEAAGGVGKRHQATQPMLYVLTAVCFSSSIGTGWRDVVCDVAFLVVIGADIWDACMFRREMERGGQTG